MNDIFKEWYVWMCLTIMFGFVLMFIIAQTYAWHPIEMKFYANDEMVATSKNVLELQKNENFNYCTTKCLEHDCDGDPDNGIREGSVIECYNACVSYYTGNTSIIDDTRYIKMVEDNNKWIISKIMEHNQNAIN